MDIVNKNTWKTFSLSVVAGFSVSIVFSQWLMVLAFIWILLAMGGFVPWWSKHRTAFTIQWGIFFGLTLGLALLIFGPWEFYS